MAAHQSKCLPVKTMEMEAFIFVIVSTSEEEPNPEPKKQNFLLFKERVKHSFSCFYPSVSTDNTYCCLY